MDTFEDLTEASTLLDADELLINHPNNLSEKVSGIHVKESVLTVISGLTAGTALEDTDIIYVKKSNADLRKLTGAQIKAEVLGSISGLTAGTGLADTDIVYIKDSSNNLKKLTGADLKSSISINAKLLNTVTVTGPALSNGGTVKIMFTGDITGVDDTTGLEITYNSTNIPVKVGKDGSLVDFTAKEITSGTYTYIQAYTTLEFVYDGTNFVIVGNPIVISDDGYAVHADGIIDKDTEFLVSITGGGADDPEAQTGTTYSYDIGPDYGIEVGDVIKVTFEQTLQSSSAITKVSLTCGGKTGDIVTTQPDTTITDAPAAGYKWIASHEFTGGNYSATYKHKVWDANTTLELTWTGTYWLADSDTVVCSYTSSTQSYLIKTNGFIKQWGIRNIAMGSGSTYWFDFLVIMQNTNYVAFIIQNVGGNIGPFNYGSKETGRIKFSQWNSGGNSASNPMYTVIGY